MSHRTGFEEQEGAVIDLQGNWWYQDPKTASWYIWNGKTWQRIPGAAPRIAPKKRATKSKKSLSWSCLLTFFTSILLGILVVGGFTLVAFNFYPAYHIIPGHGDANRIAIMIGVGLLMVIFGVFMIFRSFSSVITLRNATKDEKQRSSRQKGCGLIFNSLGQLIFGLFFLAIGLGLVTVVFYQEVLPWLGY